MVFAQIILLVGLLIGLGGFALRYRETRRRPLPADRSPLKGNPTHGITYALTAGMMPWAKESTRLHTLAYLRGIGMHLGIFLGLGSLVILPLRGFVPQLLLDLLAIALAAGSLLGAAGGVMRLVEHNLRGLSLPDDHFAVWLVSLFMALGALAARQPAFITAFYIVAGLTLAYTPLGKIRHCMYFFFSRVFFGKFFGRRAVLPHPKNAP